jgi:predicted component of type VI protein secretion system
MCNRTPNVNEKRPVTWDPNNYDRVMRAAEAETSEWARADITERDESVESPS